MAYNSFLANVTYGEPQPARRSCDNRRIPVLVPVRPLTRNKLFGNCATRTVFGVTDPFSVISRAVARAVEMLDNTIGELVNGRNRVCAGEPPAWPVLGDITLDWLKNRLSVCIENIRVWTAGTFVNRSVAEVIRRLTRVRNLIAGNHILYVCAGPLCARGDWAYVLLPTRDDDPNQIDCSKPIRNTIRFCYNFWVPASGVDLRDHVEFQAQTIIHEASHLYHCTADYRGHTIGVAECLAQFVAVTNNSPIDPNFAARCTVSNLCVPTAGTGVSGIFGFGAAGTGSFKKVATIFRPQTSIRLRGRPAVRR